MVTKVETFAHLLENAESEFRKRFNREPTIIAAAPGRVNLIGEHIDYNDGFVLPMALPMVTIVVGGPPSLTNSTTANIATLTQNITETEKEVSFDVKNLFPGGSPKWLNYIKGVIHHFPALVPGFDAVIATNVPIGGGLSSSASLEVSMATFLESLTKVHMASQADKALLCQKAEHTFAGMPCGIMDQTISVMGQQNHALLIDCMAHTATLIPFRSDSLSVLIINSNVKHELSSSQYAVRREECQKALSAMGCKSYRELVENGDVDDDNGTTESFDVDGIISRVKDEVQRRRAKHVLTEISRTRAAAVALRRNDFKTLGRLMNDSHESLDKDFEVSCPETNVLVELTRKCAGVYGSRQTGGGFGGCTVTLIEKDKIDEAIEFIAPNYEKQTGYQATFFIAEPSDGARVIKFSK